MSSEVYFLQIWKMYFLLNIVRIFSLQGPSLTTAPIDASYNFTLYLDEWVFEKAADCHEAMKDEAKKGDLAEVGFALVDPQSSLYTMGILANRWRILILI